MMNDNWEDVMFRFTSLRSRFSIFTLAFGAAAAVALVLFFSFHVDSLVRRQVREQTSILASSLDWAIAPLLEGGSTSDVQRLIENIGSYKQIERIRIYNRQGRIIASNSVQEVGEEDLPKVVERVFSGERLSSSHADFDTDTYTHAVPIRGTAYLRSERSDITHSLFLQADVTPIRNNFGVLFRGMLIQNIMLIALITLTLLYFFSTWVLRPLRLFMSATERMQKGEYHQKVDIKTQDEFASFASLFNSMAEEIEEKNRHLESYSEKLKRANETILHQEKLASLGQLAAGIAHEINNPVGYIMSNLGTLEEYAAALQKVIEKDKDLEELIRTGDYDGAREKLREIEEIKGKEDLSFILEDLEPLLSASLNGTKRVRDIVADLKDFARMDDTETEEMDVNEAVEKALTISWNELKYHCEVEKDFDELPRIEANKMHLAQVFINILVNAAQAIESRGKIYVRTERENGWIAVHISDTGTGISEEHKSRIFDPFFTTKEVGRGTGMGLSISHGIVQRHGGTIEVESNPGEGATFTVRLPVTPHLKSREAAAR